MLAIKHSDLSSILGTHMVEGEKILNMYIQIYTCTHTHTCTCIHRDTKRDRDRERQRVETKRQTETRRQERDRDASLCHFTSADLVPKPGFRIVQRNCLESVQVITLWIKQQQQTVFM